MYALHGHPAATGPRRKLVWRKAAAWLGLVLLLSTAARLWQITSDSMLATTAHSATTESRDLTGVEARSPTGVSMQVDCVPRDEIDVYTAALMDREQLRNLETSLCR